MSQYTGEVDINKENDSVKKYFQEEIDHLLSKLQQAAPGLTKIQLTEDNKITLESSDEESISLSKKVIERLISKERIIINKKEKIDKSKSVLVERQEKNNFFQKGFYIDIERANAILGVDNKNIQNIKDQSGATSIRISREDGHVMIRGDTKESVEKAGELITGGITGEKIMKMQIPPHLVGYFIGVQGRNIEELRRSFPDIRLYITNDGEIQLIGEESKIEQAKHVILLDVESLKEIHSLNNENIILSKCFQSIRKFERKKEGDGDEKPEKIRSRPYQPSFDHRRLSDSRVVQPMPHAPYRALGYPQYTSMNSRPFPGSGRRNFYSFEEPVYGRTFSVNRVSRHYGGGGGGAPRHFEGRMYDPNFRRPNEYEFYDDYRYNYEYDNNMSYPKYPNKTSSSFHSNMKMPGPPLEQDNNNGKQRKYQVKNLRPHIPK